MKLNEIEFFGAFLLLSINKITIEFNHTINEVCSYSGCPKSLQENNKMHDKSVLLGSLT